MSNPDQKGNYIDFGAFDLSVSKDVKGRVLLTLSGSVQKVSPLDQVVLRLRNDGAQPTLEVIES